MAHWENLNSTNISTKSATGGAEKTDINIFKTWATKYGIIKWRMLSLPLKWILFIKYGKVTPDYGGSLCWPDEECGHWADHIRAFKDNKGKVYIVCQPYLEPAELRTKLELWARRRGLHVEIHDKSESWYYPGETCLIVITAGAEPPVDF